MAARRARDFTEDQLLASRYRLIEKMHADLLADIHVQTERIFCELLAEGGRSFRLEGKGLSWELVEKLVFEVTQPPDFPIAHKGNGQPVEKSLFEQIWSKHFNSLEKEVALYIDDVKAVRWSHRIAVQPDWYLDGWKKKKVSRISSLRWKKPTASRPSSSWWRRRARTLRTRTPTTSESFSRRWNGTATAACPSASFFWRCARPNALSARAGGRLEVAGRCGVVG